MGSAKAKEQEIRIVGIGLAALAVLAALLAIWLAVAISGQLRSHAPSPQGRARRWAPCSNIAEDGDLARSARSVGDHPYGWHWFAPVPRRVDERDLSAAGAGLAGSGLSRRPRRARRRALRGRPRPSAAWRSSSAAGRPRSRCSVSFDLTEPLAGVRLGPQAIDAVLQPADEEPLVGQRPVVRVGPARREAHGELEGVLEPSQPVLGKRGARVPRGLLDEPTLVEEAEADLVVQRNGSVEPGRVIQYDAPMWTCQ